MGLWGRVSPGEVTVALGHSNEGVGWGGWGMAGEKGQKLGINGWGGVLGMGGKGRGTKGRGARKAGEVRGSKQWQGTLMGKGGGRS